MIKFPYIFRNNIIIDHLDSINNFLLHNKSNLFIDSGDFWSSKVLNFEDLTDKKVKDILWMHKHNLLNKFYEHTNSKQKIYCDSLNLVRFREGDSLPPHADSQYLDGSDNYCAWRDFGTVTFLNDSFEGGELHFPNLNITIEAQIGYSVIFPGDLSFLHGVHPVKSGYRYTLGSFLTYDKSKKLNYNCPSLVYSSK